MLLTFFSFLNVLKYVKRVYTARLRYIDATKYIWLSKSADLLISFWFSAHI